MESYVNLPENAAHVEAKKEFGKRRGNHNYIVYYQMLGTVFCGITISCKIENTLFFYTIDNNEKLRFIKFSPKVSYG